MTRLSDSKLIELLKGSERECDLALANIQKYFKGINTLYKYVVVQGKKSTQDFEEITNDALLALAINVRRGDFQSKSKLDSYFTSIGKNIWKTRQARSKQAHTQLLGADFKSLTPEIDRIIETDYLRSIIRKSYSKITVDCKQLIVMRFEREMKAEAIAELLEIEIQSVRNKLSKCRKKLGTFIKMHIHE